MSNFTAGVVRYQLAEQVTICVRHQLAEICQESAVGSQPTIKSRFKKHLLSENQQEVLSFGSGAEPSFAFIFEPAQYLFPFFDYSLGQLPVCFLQVYLR
ncbi:MAG TPA: hypothetical protein VIK64_07760, partial [Anaerolineales bacterium]